MKSSLILGYGSTGKDIEQYLISQNKNYLIHDDLENIDKKYKFNTCLLYTSDAADEE